MDFKGAFVWFFQFFTTKPFACDPSSLPKYPPSKEFDAKLRDEEARRYITEIMSVISKPLYALMPVHEKKRVIGNC
jgi:hypothetical protein